MPGTGGGGCDEDQALLDRRQFLEQLALDGGGRLLGVVRALLERIERHEDRAGIGRIGEGRAGEADDVHCMRDARDLERDLGRLAVDLVGAVERSRRRQLGDDDQVAAVELRDEADRRLAELVEAEGDHAGIDDEHERGEAHELARQPAVAAGQLVETPVEHGKEAADRLLHQRPSAIWCLGLSSSAQSAGDSVSETISEMTVAPAMVSANWR